MTEIKFLPANKVLVVQEGTNLMAAIIRADLPIGSSCGAVGICSKCTVKVIEGQENLSKPNDAEKALKVRENFPEDSRVSCQTKILGKVSVTTGILVILN